MRFFWKGDKDLKKVIKGLEKLRNATVPKRINQVLDANSNELVASAKAKAPINDGDLRLSLGWRRDDQKKYGYLRIIFADKTIAPHAPYVEFGTGGKVNVPKELKTLANKIRSEGSGRSFEQGLDAIKSWCRKKGIEESAARWIFYVILKEGVSPQPFLYPSWQKQRLILVADLRKLLSELGNTNLKK